MSLRRRDERWLHAEKILANQLLSNRASFATLRYAVEIHTGNLFGLHNPDKNDKPENHAVERNVLPGRYAKLANRICKGQTQYGAKKWIRCQPENELFAKLQKQRKKCHAQHHRPQ